MLCGTRCYQHVANISCYHPSPTCPEYLRLIHYSGVTSHLLHYWLRIQEVHQTSLIYSKVLVFHAMLVGSFLLTCRFFIKFSPGISSVLPNIYYLLYIIEEALDEPSFRSPGLLISALGTKGSLTRSVKWCVIARGFTCMLDAAPTSTQQCTLSKQTLALWFCKFVQIFLQVRGTSSQLYYCQHVLQLYLMLDRDACVRYAYNLISVLIVSISDRDSYVRFENVCQTNNRCNMITRG